MFSTASLNSLLKTGIFGVILGAAAIPAAPQTPSQCVGVTSSLMQACTEAQNYLSNFNSTLAQWNGTKPPVVFATELLSANANRGLKALLSPSTMNGVQTELENLKRSGAQSVTIAMGFPIVYQPFYQWNGDPQDYDTILNFYQNAVAQARSRGFKVIIETSVMFPSYASDLPLSKYYSTLSLSQISDGRAQNALVIAQQVQPDYLNLGSEPDTQSALLGLSAEYTAQQYATDISNIVSTLRSGGIYGAPLIGAGIGSWQQNGSDYVNALLQTGIDYFDMHIYSVNMNFLEAGVQYINMAESAGKRAAISEAWLHKMTDEQLKGQSEFGIINILSSTSDQDAYSFWQPVDGEFVSEIAQLSYWKNLLYTSFFPNQLFFAYLDYSQVTGLSGNALNSQLNAAAMAAWKSGAMSQTGQTFNTQTKITGPVAVLSANTASLMAPDSIISIYGSNLAGSTDEARSQPLPTSLGGVTVTLTDGSGTKSQLGLIYVSATQINAVIPGGVKEGSGVLTLATPAGNVTAAAPLAPVSPALFAANANGTGAAAAEVVTNHAGGAQTTANAFQCPGGAGSCTSAPIDLSAGSSALVLYGTGIRGAALSDVAVHIGAQTLSPFFAGAAPGYAGLDQVNVILPSSLAGKGSLDVSVTVAGAVSNPLTVAFK